MPASPTIRSDNNVIQKVYLNSKKKGKMLTELTEHDSEDND
jgi:hypothetical protein